MMSYKVGVAAALAAGTLAVAGVGQAHADPKKAKFTSATTSSGSGCPAGSVSSVLSPDASKLALFFGAYVAETAGNKKNVHLNCDVVIPLEVPAGYRATVVGIDYRGYAYVPDGGEGEFRARYHFSGNGDAWQVRPFAAGTDALFTESALMTAGQNQRSKCGKKSELRLQTQMRAKRANGRDAEDVYLSLDSADLAAGDIELRLTWAPCQD